MANVVNSGAAWLPQIQKGAEKVLCIGAVMADIVCHVPRLPERGEGVLVEKRDIHLGGCAFNSGNIIRQLGHPCFLMAPIGHGLFADFVRKHLSLRGLEAMEVETSLDCGSCTCYVEPDGERTMITSPGIERCFDPSWFNAIDASEFGLALASGYEVEGSGGDAILGFFEANPSIYFAYAPGPRIMGVAANEEKMARIRALRPLWHLNDLELKQFVESEAGLSDVDFDVAGAWLASEYEVVVVATRGSRGATAFFPDGESVCAAADPVAPVDTVGAGDTHLGALLAALGSGLSWEDALVVANRAAAAVCQVEGGTLSDEDFAAFALGWRGDSLN